MVALRKGAYLVGEPAEIVEGALCLGSVKNGSGNHADILIGYKPGNELAYLGADGGSYNLRGVYRRTGNGDDAL